VTVGVEIEAHLVKKYSDSRYISVLNTPIKQMMKQSTFLRDHYHLKKTAKIFLYVGGFWVPGRAIFELLEAFSLLKKEDIVLVFVGYGKDDIEQRMHAFIENHRLEEKILILGAYDSTALWKITCSADFGLVALLGDEKSVQYCLPVKLFDYIQAGLPVLASHYPAVKKFMKKYPIGLSFDPDDPRDIAEKIMQMKRMPDHKIKKLTELEKHIHKKEFNWEVQVDKLITAYSNIK
jgi:glycosyltransferase involved in cell wall biosynthesis